MGAAAPPGLRRVQVTVVDGDTRARLARAVVAVAGRTLRTTVDGVAVVRLRRPAPLAVRAWAPGYRTRVVRFPFQRRWGVTLRLYRPALQWTMYGAGDRRTQAHPAIRVRPPFRVVWSRGVGSLVEFPAVVSDGVAYVGNYKGTVYALSMRNGRYVWRYDPPGGKMASSPAIWGDALVVHGMDGLVRVLDRATGRLRRQVRIGSAIESSPVVRDGIDYFGAWNGRIYALDLRTGRLRWSTPSGYKITSSAALQGRRLYIGDYGGRLLGLDTRTGRVLFVRRVNGRVYGTPAVAGGRVFVPSSTGNSLTAFTTSGRYLWRVRTGGYVYSSPAVWRGRVFFGSYDGHLYAVFRRHRSGAFQGRRRRPGLGRCGRGLGRRVRRQHVGAHHRHRRGDRRPGAALSARGVRARFGERGQAAPARLLPHLGRGARAEGTALTGAPGDAR